jgi:PIN domain nuclease of toxin-antitoxin system
LLDTHALLWWLDGGRRLSKESRSIIQDPDNEVYVSAASAWEIVLKKSIGKLVAPENLRPELDRHRFERLSIRFQHVAELQTLPPIHRDPFDRMLVAQSRIESLMIVTRDPNIPKYAVRTIRA